MRCRLASIRHLHHTYEDYLGAQEASDVRLEYWAGEIYAMAGGTPEHAALSAQVIALLATKLPSGCRPFSSDMKVRIPSVDVTVYPTPRSFAASSSGLATTSTRP